MHRSKNFIDNVPLLYLVATPIGNLKEVSFRTIEVLKEVDLIVCEDTRVTSKLLKKYKIEKPMISLEKHNEIVMAQKISKQILEQDTKVAYLSDAGYPSISDPGNILVDICLKNGINVSIVSGASACLTALCASGLNTEHFYFHGFLDSKEKVKVNELKELYKRKETLIFYESPYRIKKTLDLLANLYGSRRACIARELTKKHEEYIRGNLDELAQIDPLTLKGEIVLIVEGYNGEIQPTLDNESICRMVISLMETGVSAKDAIKRVSEITNLHKNYIYKIFHHN